MLKDTILCLRLLSYDIQPIISFYSKNDYNILEKMILAPLRELYPEYLNKIHLIAQEGSSESERFANAFLSSFRQLKLDIAIILGSDTPHLQPKLLEKSIEILTGQNTAVLGPSQRGGFYLLGIQQLFRDLGAIFQDSNESLNAMEILSKKDIIIHLLPQVSDIDTIDDLLNVQALIGLLKRSPSSLNYYLPYYTNKILNSFNSIIKQLES